MPTDTQKSVRIVGIDKNTIPTAQHELATFLNEGWTIVISTSTSDMGFIVLTKDVFTRPQPQDTDPRQEYLARIAERGGTPPIISRP